LHRSAHLLKQQTSITIYCLPTKENKPLFSVCKNQKKCALCCFLFVPFSIYIYMYIISECLYIYIDIYLCRRFKRKTEAQSIFLFPSSCKQKFAFCLFVYEETNGTFPFKKLLNRLTHFVQNLHNPEHRHVSSYCVRNISAFEGGGEAKLLQTKCAQLPHSTLMPPIGEEGGRGSWASLYSTCIFYTRDPLAGNICARIYFSA
jgi:hypothetical protein